MDRFYASLRTIGAGSNISSSESVSKQKIEAYKRINIYLQKFLLHGNANIKYHVENKGILETILNIEFKQMLQDTDPCILYRGMSHLL